jgi:hypothetical protein
VGVKFAICGTEQLLWPVLHALSVDAMKAAHASMFGRSVKSPFSTRMGHGETESIEREYCIKSCVLQGPLRGECGR